MAQANDSTSIDRPELARLGTDLSWLSAGGEMGQRISSFDWSATPLGPLQRWPQSLRTSVSLMLSSQHPMWIGWGPRATFLYNDAYVSVLSRAKHPWALGRPAAEVWAEIWDICGPLADKVFQRGEPSYMNDVELFMNRGDFVEETYYSFSYSPIRDEAGNVGGLFCPSAEVSSKVLNTRRLGTLSELAANSLIERTVERACASAFATLAKNAKDVPFAALYLFQSEGSKALRCAATCGLRADDPLAAVSPAGGINGAVWPLEEVLRDGHLVVLPVSATATLPVGPAAQRIREAVALPVTTRGNDRPLGVIVIGVNPARPLDAEYRTFFELLAGQLATAIQNARSVEEDKRRAEELAELDRAKMTFFSNVSHELRTPLTLMLGPIEEIANQPDDAEAAQSRQLATLAHRNGLRLLKLVNALLDFSRMEGGSMQASFEPTPLGQLTAELAGTFRSAMEKSGLTLVVDCPPLTEPAYVDRDHWEKIVLNLISNAFKFTLKGEIRVAVQQRERDFQLTVQDTGVGITTQAQTRLFERFYRVEGALGRTQEGTGIGLALVRDLAKLHGGTVEVTSLPQVGSTFTVTIPRGSAHLPVERVRGTSARSSALAAARPFVLEAGRWARDLSTSGAHPAEPIAAEPAPSNARVLLVDDNADMRDYVSRLLAPRFSVRTATNGVEALDILGRDPVDLILSDVMMPHLDGFGLVKAVRGSSAWRALPVILLSARAGEEARVSGIDGGADDYLVKPFSARELVARVSTHIELARLRKEMAERLSFSLGAMQLGDWSWDPATDLMSCSARTLEIFGLPPGTQITREEMRAILHPDDREMARSASRHAYETATAYDIEYRVVHPVRGVRWVAAKGRPYLKADRHVQGMMGVVQDITERKQAELQLRRQKDVFEQIVVGSPLPVILESLTHWVEEFSDRPLITAVQLVGSDGTALHPAAGRSVPPDWTSHVHRVPIASDRSRLGTFAIYYPEPTEPSPHEIDLVGIITRVAAIAIERKQAEEALSESRARLEEHAQLLEKTVTERTAKLRETIGELEAFSYSISHDMRAPLRAMQGYANLLVRDYAPQLDREGSDYLTRIAKNAARLELLVRDVLAYSKVAKEDITLSRIDLDVFVPGLLAQITEFQRPDLQLVVRGPLPLVLGHEAYLSQVLTNLVGNAIKFATPGRAALIEISATVDEGMCRVAVKDNGIGIDPHHFARIFEIFGRVYPDKQFEGTGIGLSIVRKAVQRMGGTVGVESALGKGSTFWFTLRVA